jgi:N-acyl-D-aspartate/D-glutamate deacylase
MDDVFDVVINNGRVFDGLGSPAMLRHVAIRDGKIAVVSEAPFTEGAGTRVIDARGHWVMPGFIDAHTHYDAEVLVSPGLGESVRHGVTTVFLGNCSLSTIYSDALDCADLFSRVEALPRAQVLHALETRKSWTHPAEYVAHLQSLPLGPNVAGFLGHSDLRASVMGLGRASDPDVSPEPEELAQMRERLEDAIEAGLLGLSCMKTTFDKLDGDRYRSRPLPSTFAGRRELRMLYSVLRRRERVLQSAPNVERPVSVVGFFAASVALWFRRSLKISLLTAADTKALPVLAWLVATGTRIFNRLFGAAIRWQHLPVPFEIYADGIDQVVFEEFGAGRAALHLKEQIERNRLFRNEGYRRRFRRECSQGLTPRVWNRNFYEVDIVACPDETVVGMSVGSVADRRGIHPADTFLDLVVEHGTLFRWKTVIANHRPDVLNWLSAQPAVQMGFMDSGAHLRNLAFYNSPIRFLRRVREAESRGEPFMTTERAVHRLTGELAEWFGVDAGTLRVGDRADVVIVDPKALDASVDQVYEAPFTELGGVSRMVNRSGQAVVRTLIGGRVVFEGGAFAPGYGDAFRTGCFLRAGERVPPACSARPAGRHAA